MINQSSFLELPEGWRVVRFKFLTRKIVAGPFGSSLTKEMYTNAGYRVYGPEQVIPNHFSLGDYYIPEKLFREMRRYAVAPGDVLISCVGTHGRVAVFPSSAEPGIINPRLIKISPDPDQIVPEYMALLLQSAEAYSQIDALRRGGTMDVINIGLLSELRLPVPPLACQQWLLRLVRRELSNIELLVAKQERLIELLEEKRQALISHAVTKGLNPEAPMKESGVEWLGRVPANWTAGRLKHYFMDVTSGSRGWADYYSDNGPIFLRITNLTRSGIELDLGDVQRVTPPAGAEGTRTEVRSGDLLISITAWIGSVAVVPDLNEPAFVNQHLALCRPRPKVNVRWIGYFLIGKAAQAQFQQLMNGGTKAGLGLDDVKNLAVLFPPAEEQARIVAYIDAETERIATLKQKILNAIDLLRERRTALISAAVTGKIDVRQTSKELAHAGQT